MAQGWLAAAQQAARAAALAEEERRFGSAEVPLPYRWEHVQQVVRNGEWLLTQVEADRDIVLAACWLHDVQKSEPEHAQRGAEWVREFLPTTDFPAAKIGAVADAIAQHEGLWRPAADWSEESGAPFRAAPPLVPIEAGLLWDADKLSKLGPLAFLHYLPRHILKLRQKGAGLSTVALVTEQRDWLALLAPRMLASFNTLPAQQQALRLHAAGEGFWQGARAALDPSLEADSEASPSESRPSESGKSESSSKDEP